MSNYFLMKAHQVNPKKLVPGVTKWSIKLDGMRAFWDGGITRGRTDVPWCLGEMATGLWSINAKIIYAPAYWLDRLPKGVLLDGELWAGPQNFNQVMHVCRTKDTFKVHDEWRDIKFCAFELLRPSVVFDYRVIDQPTCKLNVDFKVYRYMQNLCADHDIPWTATNYMESVEALLVEHHDFTSIEDIPFNELIEAGHEGVVFRNPTVWTPTRSWGIMKMKPFIDSEGIVVGYFGGEKRLLGMIGALIVKWNGKEFKLSGMIDKERVVNDPTFCAQYPGRVLPSGIEGLEIPIGSKITFKYRELTPEGVPREARFWRLRY